MPSRPSTYLNWTNGTAPNVIQPPSSLQMSGWQAGQAPPFEYMNWLFWLSDQWIQYFATLNSVNLAPNMRFLTDAIFTYDNSTGILTWSDTIFLQVPGIPDSFNSIAAGSVTMTDGDVAYVEANIPVASVGNTATSSNQILSLTITQGITSGMNIVGGGFPGGTTVISIVGSTVTASANSTSGASNTPIVFAFSSALTAVDTPNTSLMPDTSTFIFARRFGSVVYVGLNEGGMLIQDGESKPFLGVGYLNTFSAVAGEDLVAGQNVYIATSADSGRTAGSLYLVDASNSVRNISAGFVMTSVAASGTATVVNSGSVPQSGLVPGSVYYADPSTAGGITATEPTLTGTFIISVGIAVSATELLTSFSGPLEAGVASGLVAPTQQVFSSGSGTYTPTSPSVLYIVVKAVGGGGGGGGADVISGTIPTAGGSTTFDANTAVGGGRGWNSNEQEVGGAGGGYSLATSPWYGYGSYGGDGGGTSQVSVGGIAMAGPTGGASYFGGGGHGGFQGNSIPPNTGNPWGAGGGGGGMSTSTTYSMGSAGGAGGFFEMRLPLPSTNFPSGIAYSVGAAGARGPNGAAGANGASGIIIVDEYYQ